MNKITELISWFFVGCLVVLIITHPEGFATATTAVGGQVRGMGALLTGQGQKGGTTANVAYLKQLQAA